MPTRSVFPALVLISMSLPTGVSACELIDVCNGKTRDPVKAAKKSRLVLGGTIVAFDREADVATMRVETAYRGKLVESVSIDPRWGGLTADCRGTVRLGDRYVIFTNQRPTELIEADHCGPGGAMGPESETVKALEQHFRKSLKRRARPEPRSEAGDDGAEQRREEQAKTRQR